MALLLHIDTSTELASICLSEDTQVLQYQENKDQRDHAAWIQPAIQQLMQESGIAFNELKGIGVTSGPGSYTGLRVGLSTAKGLCFALKLPLITVNTLEAMAAAALGSDKDGLLCPMIDARRMEVFTAIYNNQLYPILHPVAMQVEAHSFDKYLHDGNVIFFGNGAAKLKDRIRHVHAIFSDVHFNASFLPVLISKKFNSGTFSDLAYAEPQYFKEFYTPALKKTT